MLRWCRRAEAVAGVLRLPVVVLSRRRFSND